MHKVYIYIYDWAVHTMIGLQAVCELAPQSTMGERLSIWRPKSINLVSFQANFLVRLTVNIQLFCLISDY